MRFSEKQKRVMTWWCDGSPYWDMEAIICDGAVRSGKTFVMGVSFFCWAMARFDGMQFALCGRTIEAVRRNLLWCAQPTLEGLGFKFGEQVGRKRVTVEFGGRKNTFYLFGGKDAGSACLIQGITLAGALLDEVALMPRSFVEQTVARCSAEGAKVWFACNPEGPEHWFYKEWVCKAEERRAVRVQFRMSDNPSLSEGVLKRYERSFHGAFYRRFVLGEWAVAEGRVYDFFDDTFLKPAPKERYVEEWRISVDYGTVNPTAMGLWGRVGNVWYRMREYYWDSRREGYQKTDQEYADDLRRLAGGRDIREVVADPSAASFLTALRRAGWKVRAAENDVLTGIRVTADLLRQGKLVICEGCTDAIREFSMYCWDPKAKGDRVIKEFDHAMDEIRYFGMSIRGTGSFIGGVSVERSG